MPILYKVINRKDPRAPEGPGKYYASKMGLGMVTTKLLAKEIAERAGQSEGTVLGLLQDLETKFRLFQIGLLIWFLNLFGLFHPFQEFHFLDLLHLMRLLYKK